MDTKGSGPRPIRTWPAVAGVVATGAGYLAALGEGLVPAWPALAALAVLAWLIAWRALGTAELRARLRPRPRLVVMGVAVGLVLYGLLRLIALAAVHTPLWPWVQALGELTREAPPLVSVLTVVLVLAPAEEVLWRGVVFGHAERWAGHGWGPVVVSSALYAAAVGCSGNPVLPLAAFGCGAVWARQRQVTGSLVPGLAAHALWTALALAYLR